jgi:hypothetical protein
VLSCDGCGGFDAFALKKVSWQQLLSDVRLVVQSITHSGKSNVRRDLKFGSERPAALTRDGIMLVLKRSRELHGEEQQVEVAFDRPYVGDSRNVRNTLLFIVIAPYLSNK